MDNQKIKIDMDIKISPLFQLISYNWLIDNSTLFPKSSFIILLYIFRQTVGFRKNMDFLRYSLIERKTGLKKPTLSKHVNWLINNKFIVRCNIEREVLWTIPIGYREKIFYGLTDNLLDILYQHYLKIFKSTNLKKLTDTDIYS